MLRFGPCGGCDEEEGVRLTILRDNPNAIEPVALCIRAGGLFRFIHHNRAPCAERTGYPFDVEHCVVVRRGAHDARVTQPPLRFRPIRGSSR